jgi:hypothetical protein
MTGKVRPFTINDLPQTGGAPGEPSLFAISELLALWNAHLAEPGLTQHERDQGNAIRNALTADQATIGEVRSDGAAEVGEDESGPVYFTRDELTEADRYYSAVLEAVYRHSNSYATLSPVNNMYWATGGSQDDLDDVNEEDLEERKKDAKEHTRTVSKIALNRILQLALNYFFEKTVERLGTPSKSK